MQHCFPVSNGDMDSRIHSRASIYPRKGHTKSRRGCYSCKRRKIKCQETLPRCANCVRSGWRCQYPDQPVVTALQQAAAAQNHLGPLGLPGLGPQPVVTLSSTANVFNLTDMRLFHHYLSTAYPHFPLQSENIWLNYITPIGHECEYLMHALLALSAAHLEKLTHSNLMPVARSHACAAMAGLNGALSQPFLTPQAGDAAIAACYALFMQSWYLDDGLSAFLIISRSCQAVTGQVLVEGVDAVFAKEGRRQGIEKMRERIEGAPRFDSLFADQAKASLKALRELCTKAFEIDIIEKLDLCFDALCENPYQAYLHHVSIDELIVNLSSEELTQLRDPSDQICQLVLTHMVAMYLIMRPVSCLERRQYTATMYGIRMTLWIEKIEDGLDEWHKPYAAWPSMISELNREKVLEQYTINKDGVHQWGRRFTDGNALAPLVPAAGC